MIEFLIIISLVSVLGGVSKIIYDMKKQKERKKMIDKFEAEYPPSEK